MLDNPYQDTPAKEKDNSSDNRYKQRQGKDDSTSNAASNLNYMMKTLPSNAENPMLSLKFNEELIYDKNNQLRN
jgi:hypothetical protein